MDNDGLRLISKLTGPDSGPQFNAEDAIGNKVGEGEVFGQLSYI